MGRFDSGTGTTCSIERLEKVLSGILSDRYGKSVTVIVKDGKNENDFEDRHSDSRFDDYVRRLRTG